MPELRSNPEKKIKLHMEMGNEKRDYTPEFMMAVIGTDKSDVLELEVVISGSFSRYGIAKAIKTFDERAAWFQREHENQLKERLKQFPPDDEMFREIMKQLDNIWRRE